MTTAKQKSVRDFRGRFKKKRYASPSEAREIFDRMYERGEREREAKEEAHLRTLEGERERQEHNRQTLERLRATKNPRKRHIARYQVLFGMPGYMPDSNNGPYYASTRKELASLIRDEIAQFDLPKSLFNDVKIKQLWPFIARHGSSSAHITLYHGNNVLEFIGLTEAEAEEMESQNENL